MSVPRRALLALPFLALALAPASTRPDTPAQPDTAVRHVNHADGLALRGYDPMAWHLDRRPRRGDPRFAHDWAGVTWRFAAAAHRDRFAADPASFAPRFGGFCAFGVSQGYKVDIDPEAWQIVEARLYLNYSRGVHRRWARDIPGNIARAEANWPGISDA